MGKGNAAATASKKATERLAVVLLVKKT